MFANKVLLGSFFAAITGILPLFGQGTDFSKEARVEVSATGQSTDSVIVIPPSTSWTVALAKQAAPVKAASDLPNWIEQQSALNGLIALGHPWHIVIAYEQFDEDGDKVHSGTFEELWAGPQRYRATYKSDDLNQTDFATGTDLYRAGDQRWPNRAETDVAAEIVDPFVYAKTLQGFQMRSEDKSFGPHILHCVDLQHGPGGISSPTEYCFESAASALRYVRGWGWNQTVYNDLTSFQGHVVARDVEVTDGGKPYLKLHVTTLESISSLEATDLTPSPEAIRLNGKRVTGVAVTSVQQPFPEWPDSMRHDHFSVAVELVIGTDGHVVSATAVSGPAKAYKAAEATARKWVFKPFLILGQPTEVETKVILNNN